MDKKNIIQKVEAFVKQKMSDESTGHDWWHVDRVRKMALRIAKNEKQGDLFVIELTALIHDLDDWKFRKNKPLDHGKFLISRGVERVDALKISNIIENLSFKLGTNKVKLKTLEGKIVQDADRLDAIGAIGIARVFAFGGKMGREIHNPAKKLVKYKSLKDLKWSTNTSLHHFDEKLLLLKDKMHTKTAKKIAEGRHQFMKSYLKEFHQEWYS